MADKLNLDELDILDKQLDDIEDLAGFEVPPTGTYGFNLSMAVKEVNDKPAVEVGLELMDVVELANDNDTAPAVGTKCSMLFFLAGKEEAVKMSLGRLKELAVPLGEHFGTTNLKEIIGRCKDPILVEANLKRRTDKEDKDKHYASLKALSVR